MTDKVAADAMLRNEREQPAASPRPPAGAQPQARGSPEPAPPVREDGLPGQLAAGVAHELNNPIGFVRSNVSTLKGYLDSLFGIIQAYDQQAADTHAAGSPRRGRRHQAARRLRLPRRPSSCWPNSRTA